MNHLATVLTNTRFIVNYEQNKLVPCVELILVVAKPQYQAKGENLVKGEKIEEFRVETTLAGINELIGELQALVAGLNTFEQLAAAINPLIKMNVPEPKKAE
jgi:hypothetical protein